MRCATHPEVETGLKCSKCGKPICPKCMVQTPVGARCRECANLQRAPTYVLGPVYYLRAVGAAAGLAVALGLAWSFLKVTIFIPYLDFFLAIAAGYVIGEGVSLSVNRKRGVWLAAVGGAAVVLCFLVSLLPFWGALFRFVFSPFSILALILGVMVAVSRLR